jgi:hypothetical protein
VRFVRTKTKFCELRHILVISPAKHVTVLPDIRAYEPLTLVACVVHGSSSCRPLAASPHLDALIISFDLVGDPFGGFVFRIPTTLPTPLPPRVRLAARARNLVAIVVVFGSVLSVATVAPATPASAMRRVRVPYPGPGTAPAMEAAVRAHFPARLHRQALNVAWCESRGRASARNGQYKGHFQMGRREWATFGRGGNPFNASHNAAAAYRYYKVSGWRPWECRP